MLSAKTDSHLSVNTTSVKSTNRAQTRRDKDLAYSTTQVKRGDFADGDSKTLVNPWYVAVDEITDFASKIGIPLPSTKKTVQVVTAIETLTSTLNQPKEALYNHKNTHDDNVNGDYYNIKGIGVFHPIHKIEKPLVFYHDKSSPSPMDVIDAF